MGRQALKVPWYSLHVLNCTRFFQVLVEMTDGGCDYTFECVGNVQTMVSLWSLDSLIFIVFYPPVNNLFWNILVTFSLLLPSLFSFHPSYPFIFLLSSFWYSPFISHFTLSFFYHPFFIFSFHLSLPSFYFPYLRLVFGVSYIHLLSSISSVEIKALQFLFFYIALITIHILLILSCSYWYPVIYILSSL